MVFCFFDFFSLLVHASPPHYVVFTVFTRKKKKEKIKHNLSIVLKNSSHDLLISIYKIRLTEFIFLLTKKRINVLVLLYIKYLIIIYKLKLL